MKVWSKWIYSILTKLVCPLMTMMFCSCGKPVKEIKDENLQYRDVASVHPSTSSPGVEFIADKSGQGGTIKVSNSNANCDQKKTSWVIIPEHMFVKIPETISIVSGNSSYSEIVFSSQKYGYDIICRYNTSGEFRYCVDDVLGDRIVEAHELDQIELEMRNTDAIYLNTYKTGSNCSALSVEAQIEYID